MDKIRQEIVNKLRYSKAPVSEIKSRSNWNLVAKNIISAKQKTLFLQNKKLLMEHSVAHTPPVVIKICY